MISLLLVDDQQLICQGLKAMLSLESDLEVIGIAHNGQDALEQVEALQPDVVLMDLKMPVMMVEKQLAGSASHFPTRVYWF